MKPNLAHDDRLIRRAAGRIGAHWYVDLGSVTDLQAKLTLALDPTFESRDWSLKTAIDSLNPNSTNTELLEALRVIQLAYGDLTSLAAVGTAFEGYTFRLKVPRQQKEKIVAALVKLWDQTQEKDEPNGGNREIARILAAVGCLEGIRRTLNSIDERQPHSRTICITLSLWPKCPTDG